MSEDIDQEIQALQILSLRLTTHLQLVLPDLSMLCLAYINPPGPIRRSLPHCEALGSNENSV